MLLKVHKLRTISTRGIPSKESKYSAMPPLASSAVITPMNPSDVNKLLTLWLIDLSVAMFIGNSGEARVGSGCDNSQGPSGQAFEADCSACSEKGEDCCRFYTGSNGIRRYLAMRDSGALETLAVPEDSWATHLERLRGPPTNARPRFETLFKREPHANASCKGIADCELVILSSVTMGTYVSIKGSQHHRNLTKLHHKALSLEPAQVRKGPCLKNPGPFVQRPTMNRGDASVFRFDLSFQCPEASFTESSCRTGSLRASYPIQNPVRAGRKRK